MTDAPSTPHLPAPAGMPTASRREQARESRAFRIVKTIAHVLDDYHLDPLVGLVPVVGDVVTALAGIPAVVVSAVILRSVPLTLAVLLNVLLDLLLGIVPGFVGDVVDFFFCSNRRNLSLIRGFIDGDEAVVRAVRRRAWVMAAGVVATLAAIVALIAWLVHLVWGFVAS